MQSGATWQTGAVAVNPANLSTASIDVSLASTGDHSYAATYGGDTNFSGSSSGSVTQEVDKAPTTTSLDTNPAQTVLGEDVGLSASVTRGASGSVTFMDGPTDLGEVTLPTTPTGPDGAVGLSQFSSTNSVYAPPSESLGTLTDGTNTLLTMSAWIYPTGDMNNDGIICKGTEDGPDAIQLSFAQGFGNANKLDFRLNGSSTDGDGQLTSNTYIPDDKWTFVACTYDGTEQKIYINGALDAWGYYGANIPIESDSGGLYIGRCGDPSYLYGGHYLTFQGSIDEVDIWRDTLDATTITGLYNGGLGVYGTVGQSPWNTSEFIAGYHLDEGQGVTAHDYSVNGNDGTLVDGATWQPGIDLPTVVTLDTDALPVGANNVTAIYSGDSNYLFPGSTPDPFTVTVTPQTLYWDPAGIPTGGVNLTTFDGLGGSGDWTESTSVAYWYNPATDSDDPWTDGDIAVFASSSGTSDVTIGGQVSASQIVFDSNNYTLSGGGFRVPGGGTTVNASADVAATISADISGFGQLAVDGSGTVTLSGSNSFSGGAAVKAGMLDAASTAALPGFNVSGQVAVAQGATLAVMAGGSGWNSGSSDDIGTLLANANFASAASLGIDTSTSGFSYGGSIADSSAGPLNLLVFGGHDVTLSGNNSYTGTTKVLGGVLYMGVDNAISSSTVVDLAGGDMDLDGYTTTIGGLSGSGSLTFGGAQLTIAASSPESFGGTLSGDSQLVVAGAAPQILAGDSSTTFSGTSPKSMPARSHGFEATNPTALGESLGNVTVDDTATLAAVVGSGEWSTSQVTELLNDVVFNDGAALGFDTTGGDFTYSDDIADGSNCPLRIVVLGDHVLKLAGDENSYTGGTAVLAGTLDVPTLDDLSGYNLPGQVSVAAGATLAVYGGSSNWTSDDISALLGSASFSAGASLGLDTTAGDFSYTGNLEDTASGPMGLTVLGGNTLTLPYYSVFSYTGPTTIVSGTLELGENNELSSSTVVDMAGGNLDLTGYDLTISGLTGGSGSGNVELGDNNLTIVTSSPESYGGALSGNSDSQLTIGGSSVQTILGDNSAAFAGTVVVDNGAMLAAGIPNSVSSADDFSNITVDGGGTFAVMVGGSGWNSSTTDDIANFEASANLGAGAALGIDTTAAATGFTFGGNLYDSSSGAMGLLIYGGNTLTLTGDNTFSGQMTIAAGTVQIGPSGAMPANIPLAVNGTLDLGDYAATVTSLTGSGTVDLGSTGLTVTSGQFSDQDLSTSASTPALSSVWEASYDSVTYAYAGQGVLNDNDIYMNQAGTAFLGYNGADWFSGASVSSVDVSSGAAMIGTSPLDWALDQDGTNDLGGFSSGDAPTGTPVFSQGWGTAYIDAFGGTIEDSGGLAYTGSATLQISGPNNFTGSTTVGGGMLEIESPLSGPLTWTGGGQFSGADSPLHASMTGPAMGAADATVDFVATATVAAVASAPGLTFSWNVLNSSGDSIETHTGTSFSFSETSGDYTVTLSASDWDALSPIVTRRYVVSAAPSVTTAAAVVTSSPAGDLLSVTASGSGLFYEWTATGVPTGAQPPPSMQMTPATRTIPRPRSAKRGVTTCK